jgi:hypothetical protein
LYVRHRDRRITNLAPPVPSAQIAISWPEGGAALQFVSSGRVLAQWHDGHPAARS